jgi:DNA repair ATPase RecN
MEQLQHERDEYRDDLEQYRKSLTDKEKDYAKSIAIYENELRKLKDDFDDYVIRTDADNAQRLREYEERLKHYQSITRPEGAGGDSVSEVGASGCQRLAGVTAALDRNLIEGVTVVKQLYGIARRVGDESETLRMIVEADRKLINSSQSRLDNK